MSEHNIELRRWRPEDAAAVARLANNPNLSATLSDRWTVPYTLAQAVDFVAYMTGVDEAQDYQRAIYVDGAFAGTMGITRMQGVNRLTAELGYWLGEPYWGKGIMSRALPMAIEEALQRFPDLIRLQAETFSSNPGSCRVLEKNGFVKEGTLRQNVLKRGEVLDSWIFGRVLDRGQ